MPNTKLVIQIELWNLHGKMSAGRRVSATTTFRTNLLIQLLLFVLGVLLLSTCYSDEFDVKCNYKGEESPIPEIINYYKKAKTFVDLSDQKAAASTPHRKLH